MSQSKRNQEPTELWEGIHRMYFFSGHFVDFGSRGFCEVFIAWNIKYFRAMSKSKTRLYFGKLHETTRERDLEKFVRGYGKIREISVKRGYGFVVSLLYLAIIYFFDFS